jgi:hypothetical protein
MGHQRRRVTLIDPRRGRRNSAREPWPPPGVPRSLLIPVMLWDADEGCQIRTIDCLVFEGQLDDLIEHGAVLREQGRRSALGLSK